MTVHGVIRGKTIELETELGLPEGQTVAIDVRPVTMEKPDLPSGEGIRQSAGAWADAGEELDAWLNEMQQSRQQERPELS